MHRITWFQAGEEFRALPGYSCSGNGSYFGLTLSFGILNADSGPFAFVCLFCNMDIKVVERRQFHWV